MRLRVGERLFDEDVGQRGDLGSNFRQRGDPQYVAQYDADVFAAFETRQQRSRVAFEGARAQARESLAKLFTRMGAIERVLAAERVKDVGRLDQCFAQVLAVAEDQQR